jgi:TolB protein
LRTFSLLAFAGFLALGGCNPSIDKPAQLPAGPVIAFSSDRFGTLDIFSMAVPGDSMVGITMGERAAYGVAWHPSGKEMAYATQSDSITAIMRVNLETGERDTLISGPFYYGGPEWTPDGGSIIFVSDQDNPPAPRGAGRELYRMTAEGSGIERLTFDDVYQGAPRLSPDGTRLAFCQLIPTDESEPLRGAIYVGNADASNAERITDEIGMDCLPTWSPDGSQVAFHRCEQTCAILVVGADGAEPRIVRSSPEPAQWPAWSPDGEWIAFTLSKDNQTDIYRIHPDGTGEEQVTFTPSREEAAEWRPED